MISYRPIQFDLGAGATAAELGRLEMTCRKDVGANELEAYFTVSGEDHLLRVFFHHVDIFRVIDDVHLPLEENGIKAIGHVAQSFRLSGGGEPILGSAARGSRGRAVWSGTLSICHRRKLSRRHLARRTILLLGFLEVWLRRGAY